MNYQTMDIIFEFVGTVSFAFSGAMVGIRKGLDLLGVVVLGIVTALGGGCLRDLILGNIPPQMFRDSYLAVYAVISSLILFLIFYIKIDFLNSSWMKFIEKIMLFFDAVGLGAFTITGINTALSMGYDSKFLLIFVGMVTGVGGGVIRDVLASNIPVIFREEIYGIASLFGAIIYIVFLSAENKNALMIVIFLVIVLTRLWSVRHDVNLPRIKK
ncbi:trimeric intracellular cation channel family protein [Peptoniphilus obesi]|uniref:trimeric intracellular cation channel family protein n=1 Tax=Peptoniphilus obesi TaxID=1472765 RepID=UPI0004B2793B|nr:TRIC cation channel family protein [Peptoniphilus obesi]